jgi:hypothetical protein
MDFSHITADKREALYNEVWSEPVITVAKRYGMSDNGLRKHCKKLGIPLPFAGYWARIKAGQQVPRTPLPKVTGELKDLIRNYFIKYKTEIEKLTDAELAAAVDVEFSLFSEETKKHITEICSDLQVKSQLRHPHHRIIEHKEEITYRKKSDKALKRASFSSSYYFKVESEYRDNKPVLPIKVSEFNINRTNRILDTIIRTIEEMEGHIEVSSDQGKDKASFTIIHCVFNFEVREDARKSSAIKNGELLPRLVLSMSLESSSTSREQIKSEYKDKDNEPLETQVGRIIFDMFVTANKQRVKAILLRREQQRAWEEQQRKWCLEEMRKGELAEVRLLEQTASTGIKQSKLEDFRTVWKEKLTRLPIKKKGISC